MLHPCLPITRHHRNFSPLQKDAISRLLHGFGISPNAFCDRYVSRLFWLPSAELPCYLEFLRELYHACNDDSDTLHCSFKLAISHHSPFWINSLVILRRMARNVATFDPGHQRISLAIVGHAAACLYYLKGNMYECERIIVQWITADIFGTFEDILGQSLSREEFASKFLIQNSSVPYFSRTQSNLLAFFEGCVSSLRRTRATSYTISHSNFLALALHASCFSGRMFNSPMHM